MEAITVIGAGGFVGSSLVESLVLNGHSQVRAVVRSYRSIASLARFGSAISIVVADAENTDKLADAVRGSSAVVNVTTGAPKGIVATTQSILKACSSARVDRLVHLSSAVIYGDVESEIVDDDAPPPSR